MACKVVKSKPLGMVSPGWESPKEVCYFHVHINWVHFELIAATFKIKIDLLMAAWSKRVWSVIQLSKYSIADWDSFSITVQKQEPVWHLAAFLTALLMFTFFAFFSISDFSLIEMFQSPWFFFFFLMYSWWDMEKQVTCPWRFSE